MRISDNDYNAAVEQLGRVLGTKVQIVERDGGGGTIMIECYSAEEMQRVFDCLTSAGDAAVRSAPSRSARLSV